MLFLPKSTFLYLKGFFYFIYDNSLDLQTIIFVGMNLYWYLVLVTDIILFKLYN